METFRSYATLTDIYHIGLTQEILPNHHAYRTILVCRMRLSNELQFLLMHLFSLHRENGSSEEGECTEADKQDSQSNGDHKRKQSEVVSEPTYPNKSPKNVQDGQQSSSRNRKSSSKQPKNEKLDWSVLRPPKGPKKKGKQN